MGEMVVDSYNHDGYLTTSDGKLDDHYAAFLRNSAERDEQAELWLAVDSEHILGCVTWCPVGSPYRELATNDQQGEFRSLAVAPPARGRGAGRALVEFCLERARSDGLAVLSSLPEMLPAHRLYASVGFTRRPESDWSPLAGVNLWAFATDSSN